MRLKVISPALLWVANKGFALQSQKPTTNKNKYLNRAINSKNTGIKSTDRNEFGWKSLLNVKFLAKKVKMDG
jgi:hypothetical protein